MTITDWFTNENNPSLDKSEYLYGIRHIMTLIITLLLCITLFLIFRKKSSKSKVMLFNSMAGILLFFEIISRIINLVILDEYNLENIVQIIFPMHICSVMVWVFIVAIFTKKRILLNYSVICGLIATLAFLLYPAVGLNRVYMSFTCIYSTFSHMIGFVTVFLMISLKEVDFKIKKIYEMYLCFTLMFSYGAVLNYIVFPGSDYMYMRNDPLGLNLNFPYQILYGALIVIYVLLFHVGYELINKIKERKRLK